MVSLLQTCRGDHLCGPCMMAWCGCLPDAVPGQLLTAFCPEGVLLLHSCKLSPAELPDRSILQTAESMQKAPLPVPNLGYCCLNMALREQKPPIFTNRWDCPHLHRPAVQVVKLAGHVQQQCQPTCL